MKASDDWQHIKLQHRMFFVRLAVRVSQGTSPKPVRQREGYSRR